MRWKKALGRSVINTESAEAVGRVDGFVIDPLSRRITTVVVGDKVISWKDCAGIGTDAVTIAEAGMLDGPSSELENRVLAGEGDPIGKPVITEDGVAMGSLTDIDFDPESGAIRRLVMADDEVSGSRLIGSGAYAVVISSSRRSSGANDLGSLSKSELYERAKERDIEGRSSMTKKELITALS